MQGIAAYVERVPLHTGLVGGHEKTIPYDEPCLNTAYCDGWFEERDRHVTSPPTERKEYKEWLVSPNLRKFLEE